MLNAGFAAVKFHPIELDSLSVTVNFAVKNRVAET